MHSWNHKALNCPFVKIKMMYHRIFIHTSKFGSPFNSLAPGRSECDSKNVTFKFFLLIASFRCTYDNALRWMPQDLTDDKSALVQVMAWCHQATSHYLSQCWLSSLSPYGVARPQWVKAWWCLWFASSLVHVMASDMKVAFLHQLICFTAMIACLCAVIED